MGFDIDVLIVFAEKDNHANKSELGWVSQFKKFLELMLNQVLGEKSRIMLKEEFDTITSPNLDNVGVLVPVLSKEFMQSRKCIENLEAFIRVVEPSSKTKNRIFKVFKTPLNAQEQPPRLRRSLSLSSAENRRVE